MASPDELPNLKPEADQVISTERRGSVAVFTHESGRQVVVDGTPMPPQEFRCPRPGWLPAGVIDGEGEQAPNRSVFNMSPTSGATGMWPGEPIGNGTPEPLPKGTRLGGRLPINDEPSN